MKRIRLKKYAFVLLGLLAVLSGAVFLISARGRAVVAAAIKRELPIYCVEKQDKVVSLSFDAAWGNEDTEELIEILGRYGVKATFFVVGEWAEKYPESVKALADAGHEVMNHSDTHEHFTKLSPEQMTAEINACSDKIEKITGVRPLLFRAPYGDYNDSVIKTVKEAGVYPIQWDVDSLDWKGYDAETIKKRVLKRVSKGSIVLFHNAAEHTPEALPGIIEGLISEGYTFAPVSQLIYRDSYTIDHSGRQIPVQNGVQ